MGDTMKIGPILIAALCGAAASAQSVYTPYVVVGGSSPFVPSLQPPAPYGRAFTWGSSFLNIAADRFGNIYSTNYQLVEKFTPDGNAVPVTGYGSATVAAGDRIPAILASVGFAGGLAADAAGNLFIASFGSSGPSNSGGVYRVTTDGLIELYAPVSAGIISLDAAGNVYVLQNASKVIRIAPDRTQTTVAGTGQFGFSGDGGPATSAQISAGNLAVDGPGNIFIADTTGRIRKVDLGGTIQTIAQERAGAMTVDGAGNLYFAALSMVKRLKPDGTIENIAGIPFSAPYRGDGGPALSAWLASASGLALDPAGNLYIADLQRLRKIDTNGIIHSVAGCPCYGDNVPSTWAQVGTAVGIVRDAAGNVYFSDQTSHIVRRIAADGTLTTFAGNGESGYSGDDGPATAARLAWPAGLALDAAGNLYIADEQNSRIRRVGTDGVIHTVAGNGNTGFAGDGNPATQATLGLPDGVAVDPAGNLYIADSANHRIRKVTADGIIRTIAGSSEFGSSGDGGPAAQALLINPRMLAFDNQGNLLFTDSSARVVRRITTAGIIERVAGGSTSGSFRDGVPALTAPLDLPWGIAVDRDGNILIGDSAVRVVDPQGILHILGAANARGVATGDNGDIWTAGGNAVTLLSRNGPPFPLGPWLGPTYIGFPASSPAVVSPGQIVNIPGTRLGPAKTIATGDRNLVGTNLGGTRLLFDGIAASILNAQANAIVAAVPFEVAGKTTVQMVAEVNGLTSNPVTLAVLPAAPQWFLADVPFCVYYTPIAAVNQDGTKATYFNPAPLGTIISLFATGAGELKPQLANGVIVSAPPFPVPLLPVTVTSGTRALEVTYAGAVPGYIAGGLQVNVRLPLDLTPSVPPAGVPTPYIPLDLRIGNTKSGTACVLVR